MINRKRGNDGNLVVWSVCRGGYQFPADGWRLKTDAQLLRTCVGHQKRKLKTISSSSSSSIDRREDDRATVSEGEIVFQSASRNADHHHRRQPPSTHGLDSAQAIGSDGDEIVFFFSLFLSFCLDSRRENADTGSPLGRNDDSR